MGELEDQYDRNKKSYSNGKYANTKVFNTKAKRYNKNDLEAEEERAKRTMR